MTALQTFWASKNNRTGIGIAFCTFAGAVALHVTKSNDDAFAAVGVAAAVWKIVDPDFVPVPAADEIKAATDIAAAIAKPSPAALGTVVSDGKVIASDFSQPKGA